MVSAGMYAWDTRAMVGLGHEKQSSAGKTGAKWKEYFAGKKGAKGKETALTSAIKGWKATDMVLLSTMKSVNGETMAFLLSKIGGMANAKEKEAEKNRGKGERKSLGEVTGMITIPGVATVATQARMMTVA